MIKRQLVLEQPGLRVSPIHLLDLLGVLKVKLEGQGSLAVGLEEGDSPGVLVELEGSARDARGQYSEGKAKARTPSGSKLGDGSIAPANATAFAN